MSRRLISKMLSEAGYELEEASGGREALERFARNPPDIVLLDVKMPDLDGYDVARAIRKADDASPVQILFLTGITDEESLAECVQAGGDDFLTKPVSPTILRSKLRSLERVRNLNLMVRRQLAELSSHHGRLLRERDMARRVLDDLLGRGQLSDVDLQTSFDSESAFEGELLLAARRPDGSRVVLYSGGGAPGLAAAVSAIPFAETFNSMCDQGFGVVEILGSLHQELRAIEPDGAGRHVTFVEVNSRDRYATIWNGGRTDLLVRRDGGSVDHVPPRKIPLGGPEKPGFDVSYLSLSPGDRLLITSPQTTACADASGVEYGVDRLTKAFSSGSVPTRFLNELTAEVAAFVGDAATARVVAADILVMPPEAIPARSKPQDPEDANQEPRLKGCRVRFEFGPFVLATSDPLPPVNQFLGSLPGISARKQDLFLLLSELFYNALDHGVLGLDSSVKQGKDGFAAYYELRTERRALLEEGFVRIDLEHLPREPGGRLVIRVTDSGPGFNLSEAAPEGHNLVPSGRGIPLIRKLCRNVDYIGAGNIVEVVYDW